LNMKHGLTVLILLGLFSVPVFLNAQANSNHYISSVKGSPDGDGSAQRPWDSLDDINRYDLSAGDTVFFECGSSWTGTFEITASGSAANPIVFTSYGSGDKPAISNPDPENYYGNAIRISASYIVVENLYIHDCGVSEPRTVAGIASFDRQDQQITIQNCEFSGCRVAVRLYAHDVLITNNHMHSPGGGISQWWGPMGIVGAGYNGEISFNLIEGFLAPNNYGYDGGAIELDDEGIHTNWRIHHNISRGNEGFLETYDDSECDDCTWGDIEISYNFSDDYQWFCDGPIGDNPVIENNTILRVLPANTDFNWCISLHDRIPQASVRNNIFVLANGVTAFEWENPGSSTRDNIYFSVDNSKENPKGYPLGAGEIIADPLFINYEERDVNLRMGSPAIDMAETSRYTFDLNRNPVPQGTAPDAGAMESSFTLNSNPYSESENISVYPNPSSGIIYVSDSEYKKYQGQTISIHDLTGRVLKMTTFQKEIMTVDLADQAEGLYFVRVGSSTNQISLLF
jgi:hypothetical protein